MRKARRRQSDLGRRDPTTLAPSAGAIQGQRANTAGGVARGCGVQLIENGEDRGAGQVEGARRPTISADAQGPGADAWQPCARVGGAGKPATADPRDDSQAAQGAGVRGRARGQGRGSSGVALPTPSRRWNCPAWCCGGGVTQAAGVVSRRNIWRGRAGVAPSLLIDPPQHELALGSSLWRVRFAVALLDNLPELG